MTDGYAAYHRDEEIRDRSSSGGVFQALACEILDEGGVVFGAAFDENFHVIYKGVENKEDLSLLRGAKYVFPRIGTAYMEIRAYLRQGRNVLFVGLPCHAAGLMKFLGKPEKNLVCADLICHGAPDESVWESYLNHMKKQIGPVDTVRMREKRKGWSFYQVEFRGCTGKIYRKYAEDDPYMQGFIQDLYLRASCYCCPFKGIERKSDITLGDYWGGEKIHPDMDDDKGISLVLVHTQKGRELFEKVQKYLVWSETDIQHGIKNNPSLTKTAERAGNREMILWKLRQGESFETAVFPHIRMSFAKIVEKRCRRIWRMWKSRVKHMRKSI